MMETGWTGSIFCPHHFEHTGKVRETVKIKQLLCGVLAAAVLFTGCGAQPGTSGGSSAQGDGTPMQAKGRFVENDITPPGAAGCTPVSLTARPDGGLDYIALRPAETPGQYTYTHFYSADSGKEWTENTMDWQESFGEKRQIEKVTVTPEGEYFVMLTEQTEDGMGAVAYARVAADGTAVPVQPEGLSAQGGLVAADAQVLPGGRLLLTSFGGDFAAVQNGAAGEDAGAQAASSGTQDAAGIFATGAALNYLVNTVGYENIRAREQALVHYLMGELMQLDFVQIIGSIYWDNHHGVVSFNVKGIHPHDVASIMDMDGVCIRAGHHCAQPLLTWLGVENLACCRASVAFYNDKADIDKFIAGLHHVWSTFNG